MQAIHLQVLDDVWLMKGASGIWAKLIAAVLLGIPLLFAPAARAQNVDPRQIDADQLEQRRERPAEPQKQPEISLPSAEPEAAPDSQSVGVLAGVQIQGVTVYEPRELAPYYEPYLARSLTVDDIQGIVAEITKRYRDDGYILSRAVAPVQDLDFGILRIEVEEGYVENVVFEGPVHGRSSLLVGYADQLRAEQPLTQQALEHYVILMNDLPGVGAKPALRRLDSAPGAHELVVGLSYDPVDVQMSVDNKGTRTVGRYISELSAQFNSAFGLQERTGIYTYTVPDNPRELIFVEVQQEHVVGGAGTVVGVDAWRSLIESGSRLKPFDLDSNSEQLGFYVSQPVRRGRDLSIFVSGHFEIRNSEERQATAQTFDDRVRSLRLRTRAFFTDELSGENLFVVTGSRGLEIFGATPANSSTSSRRGGKADYTKVDFQYTRWQGLPDRWSAELGLRGQRAADGLLSAEEFRIGGSKFGRAYDPSELSGEQGIAGYAELKYALEHTNPLMRRTQVYGFYDLGRVWNPDPVTGTFRGSIASLGGGVEITLPSEVQATFEIAKPLTRPVFEEGQDGNDLRLFARLSARF